MTLGERIRKVRRDLDLTQKDFGSRIGMKPNSISLIESGRNTSDQTIFAICREFNVNEDWLRTGKGTMYVPLPKNERLEQDLRKFLTRENDSFGERLISLLLRLEPSQWEVLERYARELVEKKERRQALEDEATEYYRERVLEENPEGESSVSSGQNINSEETA